MTGDFFVLKRNPDGDIYEVVRSNTTLDEAWKVALIEQGCVVFEDVTTRVKSVIAR